MVHYEKHAAGVESAAPRSLPVPVCNVSTLCVAAITTLVSAALVGIAFSTDNWTHISVDRIQLGERLAQLNIADEEFQSDYRYFDRVQGSCTTKGTHSLAAIERSGSPIVINIFSILIQESSACASHTARPSRRMPACT